MTTTRKTMAYAVGLAAAVALALAGCNGGKESPTGSTSPTPSASGSVTGGSPSGSGSPSASGSGTPRPSVSVSVPSAARAHTEAGAIEFAKFFVTEADRLYVTLDNSVVTALSGPNCDGCSVTLDGAADFLKSGERQSRASVTVTATNVLPGGTADGMEVQVLTTDEAVDIVDKSGKATSTTEAGKTTYRLAVGWNGTGWITSDMALDQ